MGGGFYSTYCDAETFEEEDHVANNSETSQSILDVQEQQKISESSVLPLNVCRICYDDDPEKGKLLAVCKCEDSNKYIHLHCLKQQYEESDWLDFHCNHCGQFFEGEDVIRIVEEKLENLNFTDSNDDQVFHGFMLMNLGNMHARNGNFSKACVFQRKSLKIHQQVLSVEDAQIPINLTTLGNCYGNLDKPQKQIEVQERALDLIERYHCSDKSLAAPTLTNLGNAYFKLGNFEKYLELQQKALHLNQKTQGKNSEKCALNLTNMGVAYASLGDYEKQCEVLEEALIIFTRVNDSRAKNIEKKLKKARQNLRKTNLAEWNV